MAITRVQTFTVATKSDGTGSTVTNTLASVPTAGNLLVACLSSGDAGGAITVSSFSDNIGDSVSWTASSLNPVTFPGGGGVQYRIYYKVVGTPSGGLKAVQCTITGTQALALFVAEYGVSSGSPTWSVTGTPVSATGLAAAAPANAGSITTAIADAVLIGFAGSSSNHWLAGSGYTIQASSGVWANDDVEDKIVSATGTYAVDWTNPVSPGDWAAMGIAFGATTGGSAPTSYYLSDTIEM